jgi:hypothetical protein
VTCFPPECFVIKPLTVPSLFFLNIPPTNTKYKENEHHKMKLTILSILTVITVVLAAAQPQKAVIVSYPNDTPDRIIDQAKDAIIAAGGIITHEYKLIK